MYMYMYTYKLVRGNEVHISCTLYRSFCSIVLQEHMINEEAAYSVYQAYYMYMYIYHYIYMYVHVQCTGTFIYVVYCIRVHISVEL